MDLSRSPEFFLLSKWDISESKFICSRKKKVVKVDTLVSTYCQFFMEKYMRTFLLRLLNIKGSDLVKCRCVSPVSVSEYREVQSDQSRPVQVFSLSVQPASVVLVSVN